MGCSNNADGSNNAKYPFDIIVITFPDENAASFARDGPLARLRQAQAQDDDHHSSNNMILQNVSIIATCDPYGARVGSGGGTLAALHTATTTISTQAPTTTTSESTPHNKKTILIVHAGGESSRCPTQMCLGKAWTSLPSLLLSSSNVSTPLELWLLHTIPTLFPTSLMSSSSLSSSKLQGSIVVIAADTLLQLPSMGEPLLRHEDVESLQSLTATSPAAGVLALAVPTPLSTAKNHGVFVVPSSSTSTTNTTTSSPSLVSTIQPCSKVLQKPSVETLLETGNHFYRSNNSRNFDEATENDNDEPLAWIDTGVTIFLPNVAKELYKLISSNPIDSPPSSDSLASPSSLYYGCTASGLQHMYESYKSNQLLQQQPLQLTLREFCQQQALKIDLYTHILQAFRLDESNNKSIPSNSENDDNDDFETYYQLQNNSITRSVATLLYKSLHNYQLKVWCVTNGQFLHLGTTLELQEFLLYGSNQLKQQEQEVSSLLLSRRQVLCNEFGNGIQLTKRLNAITILQNPIPNIEVDPTTVIYNSILVQSPMPETTKSLVPSFIGPNTVIEHCYWYGTDPIQIGSNCCISGLRNNFFRSDQSSSNTNKSTTVLAIPNNLIVQMIPILSQNPNESTSNYKANQYVVIVLGMNDNIKGRDIIYNHELNKFLNDTALSEADLWDNHESDSSNNQQHIWNAKLHPIIRLDSSGDDQTTAALFENPFSSLFDWISLLDEPSSSSSLSIQPSSSFITWKRSERLSLSEIRSKADSYNEFRYREQIIQSYLPSTNQSHYETIQRILKNRTNEYIDLNYIVHQYTATHTAVSTKHTSDSERDNRTITRATNTLIISTLQQVFDPIILHNNNSRNEFDILSRTFMVTSGFFQDLVVSLNDIKSTEPSATIEEGDDDSVGTLILTVIKRIRQGNFNDASDHLQEIIDIRDQMIAKVSSIQHAIRVFEGLASGMEQLAQVLTEQYIRCRTPDAPSSSSSTISTPPKAPILYNRWVVASAPARIDLAGGWSDTPPVCYEYGSAVVGVAVLIDGTAPLAARCRIVPGKAGILLKSESRDLVNGELLHEDMAEITSMDDLHNCRDPTTVCSLLKCVLVQLGVITLDTLSEQTTTLQTHINQFCQRGPDEGDVRLELISTSLLPQGSGLGTSSILAGCLVAAVARCIGIVDETILASNTEHTKFIIDSVVKVEQLLTTGGGYQDQVNGLLSGIKCSRTLAATISSDPDIHIEQISVDLNFERRLGESLVLVFTGQTRLAKNLLVNVLRRWSKRTPEICENVQNLVDGANNCRNYIQQSDLDGVGSCLSEYWKLKKIMAGPESGVEPGPITAFMDQLHKRPDMVRAASLCGAGGGGFLAILTQDGVSISDLVDLVTNDGSTNDDTSERLNISKMTWHECKVCKSGLATRWLDDDSHTSDHFDISWLRR